MDRTTVRTRYAPSPTGYMHVGNLRTALYEYLIAKSQGGTFILRIEDTDQKRLVDDAVDVIYRTLKMVGLRHDEGPDIGGPAGPYVQSQRKDLYRRRAEELVAKGAAYYCFCGREASDEDSREDGESETAVFGYNRRCRELPETEAARQLADGVPHVIRQKMPLTGTTTFIDAVYGQISVENKELEDQVLLKSDGFPTYNFANVVDDHEMGITHIVRGSEYLPSTPKYSLLYEAFGWEIPVYVHLPLITGKDGKKLSKRHGSTSLEALVSEGFLPQAIVNCIALLGWSPAGTREIFSLDDLCREFSISGISKSPSVFDYDKLRWFNAEYLRAMGRDEFLALIRPHLDEVFAGKPYDGELLAEMLQPRVVQLTQVKDMVDFLAVRQDYSLDLFFNQKSKSTPDLARVVLPAAIGLLSSLQDWSRTALHDLLVQAAAGMGLKTGQLLWPVRIAVSGREVTPGGAIEILAILGKDESLARLETARQRLGPAQQA
jgi:glutamyl-tRNA synthetase